MHSDNSTSVLDSQWHTESGWRYQRLCVIHLKTLPKRKVVGFFQASFSSSYSHDCGLFCREKCVVPKICQLAWNAESGVAGYKVYSGTTSHNYTSSVDVGDQTSYTLMGLVDGTTYFHRPHSVIIRAEWKAATPGEVATGGVQTSAPASGA